MADQTVRQESINLLPEYQERFLKDLLSNIYRVDPATGQPAGIAAASPLFGRPVFDDAGNPVYEVDAQGSPRLDIRGQPIQRVEGGVPQAEIMPFTDTQRRAAEMAVQGIGAYGPMMQQATQTLQQGVGAVAGSTGAFDPMSYRAYYDPFVEQVIETQQREIARQGDIERQRVGASAVQAGAFGGSRQAVAEQELARNVMDQQARTGAQLRSAAFTGAQQQAQNVFENQMQRGQQAAQIFQGLGTSQAALGEAAQAAGQRDVNALFNVGSLEQAQRQAEYDVQRANAIELAYEPQQRFSYMSDIFRGVPSTQQTLGVTSVPTPSPVSGIIGTAMNLGSFGQQYGGGRGILGALMNPSGA
jgi:hypothetical protein